MRAAICISVGAIIASTVSGGCCHWPRTGPGAWARTFVVQKVSSGQPTRGHPFIHYEMTEVVATWAKAGNVNDTYTTMHVTVVPRLMAVDAERALLGKTKATFTNNDDGTLKSSDADLDQEIPEVINAMGNLIKNIPAAGPRPAGPPTAPTFQPPLVGLDPQRDVLVSLQFLPLSYADGQDCRR